MNRFVVFAFLLLSWPSLLTGQPKETFRFEKDVKTNEQGFTVISMRKEGLALIQETDKFDHGKKTWKLELLDTTLTSFWQTDFALLSKLILVGYEYNPGHLYLLFREGETEFHNFTLLSIPYPERTYIEQKIVFEVNFKLTHFTMAGSSAVFGGEINNEPAVLLYNQASAQPKVLPGLFKKNHSLLDVKANQSNSFNVLMAEQRPHEEKRLILRTFDQDGEILLEDVVPIDSRYSVLTGLTSSLERDELLLTGTYTVTGNRQALGFYATVADPFKEQPVTYTEFVSIGHFLDYLSDKKAEKVRLKASKKKAQGQLPEYTAYVMPYRIEERPDGFYMVSEMYYPSSTVSSYPSYGSLYNPYLYGYYPYGINPYSSSRYYTPPYSMSGSRDVHIMQTMVVKWSPACKMLRTASMGIDAKQEMLDQVGDFVVARDSIWMAYKKDGALFWTKESPVEDIDPEQPPPPKKELPKINLQDPLVLKHESDGSGSLRFWFGHHWYVWGYQRLRETKPGATSRNIFYVSRISVE